MLNRRRGMWADYMSAIFVLAAVTLIYILLHQPYVYNFRPWGIQEGTDANSLNYLDIAWNIWPIPVGLAALWSVIQRKGGQTKIE